MPLVRAVFNDETRETDYVPMTPEEERAHLAAAKEAEAAEAAALAARPPVFNEQLAAALEPLLKKDVVSGADLAPLVALLKG